MGDGLKVLMIPHYGESNPYLLLLTQALEDRGIHVALARIRGWTPLWRAVQETGKPDIIHLQWQHRFFVPRNRGWMRGAVLTVLFFVQWFTLRLSGVRFVWTVHNVTNHEGQRRRFELGANRILARLVDRMLVHCGAVIPAVARAFRVSEKRFEVCRHGTYGDWYGGPASREEAREILGLPGDARVLLYFGLIRGYKGVDRMIETFRDIEGDNLRMLVVGLPKSEGLGRQIQYLAASDPRVELTLEFVPDARLAACLKACDAVVLPYKDSLTSGAAVLAGAAHRPAVMPRLGCTKEFPDEAGYFYDPADANGFHQALRAAAFDTGDARGEAAARYVGQFTWESVAQRVEEIYAEVVGTPGATTSTGGGV